MSPRGFRLSILASLVIGLTLFGGPAPAVAAESFFDITMDGGQEVPGPGDPDGAGGAFLTIDPAAGTVCWEAFWELIDAPTAGHIHAGAAGVAGPVVVALEPFPLTESGCVDSLDTATLEAIVASPPDYYVNFHNATYPDGAIRGQLMTPGSLLFFELSGADEVPGPGDEDGDGEGNIQFLPDTSSICYGVVVERLDTVTAAHIHTGAAGVAGPVLVPLAPPVDGFSDDCVDIDDASFDAILANPAGYYVNVHTSAFPDGAIRGQLSAADPPFETSVYGDLNGFNEVPGPGDPDGLGVAEVTLDPVDGTACVVWTVRDIEPAAMAHIHTGAADVSGPVAVPLAIPPAGGCTFGHHPTLLQAIIDDPSAYYVNVHTASFPDGAIRGQLSLDPSPGLPCVAPQICNGPIPPGTYTYTGFDRLLTFTTDEEWLAFILPHGFGLERPDRSGGLFIEEHDGNVGAPPCGETVTSIGVSAAAVTSWLGTHPSLSASPPSDVMLGGLPGKQVEFSGDLDPACVSGRAYLFTQNGVPDFFWFWVGQDERVRVVAQDIASTIITILDDYSGETFDDLAASAQSEIDSMVWGTTSIPDTAMDQPDGPPLAALLGFGLLMSGALTMTLAASRSRRGRG